MMARKAQNRQRGVVLLLALIMLVAMTLAGVALYRQIGTGLIIARNLSFKRTALVASDFGVESARTWLMAQSSATLEQAAAVNNVYFYFPGWCNTTINAAGIPDADGDGVTDNCGTTPAPSEFDPMSYNWANAGLATANDGAGNDVRYVIHRLCQTPGGLNVAGQQCVTKGSNTDGNPNETCPPGGCWSNESSQPYYRVTSRVLGPTNTAIITQTIIY